MKRLFKTHMRILLPYIEASLDLSLLALPVALTFSRAIVEILLAANMALWILSLIIKREFIQKNNSFVVPVLTYCFIGLFSIINSKFYLESFRELFNLLEYSCLALMAIERFKQPILVKRFLMIIVCTTLIVSLDGFFQYFFGYDFIRHQQIFEIQNHLRISACFKHPNNLAAYLAMTIPIVLSVIYDKKWILAAFVLPIAITAIIMTYSRGAWVGLIIALFAFACLKDKKLLIIFTILLSLAFFFLPHSILQRMIDIFDVKNVTIQTRFDLWKNAWKLFTEHPIIGNGLKNFSLLFKQGYAHNCILQMMVEMGLLGLTAFIWILVSVFSKIITARKSILAVGVGCSILAATLHSVSDTNLYSTPIATCYWLLLGIGFTIGICQKEISSSHEYNKSLKKV